MGKDTLKVFQGETSCQNMRFHPDTWNQGNIEPASNLVNPSVAKAGGVRSQGAKDATVVVDSNHGVNIALRGDTDRAPEYSSTSLIRPQKRIQ